MSWLRVHTSVVRGLVLVVVVFGVLAGSGIAQGGRATAQESSGLVRAIKAANLRTKPSKNGAILVTIPKYAIAVPLGPAKGCGAHSCAWVKIAYGGYEGWSKGAYFEPALIIAGRAVAGVNVNLRATPGYDGKVLRVISAGGEVLLTGRQSCPWVSVSYRGTKGWVFAELFTVYPSPQL